MSTPQERIRAYLDSTPNDLDTIADNYWWPDRDEYVGLTRSDIRDVLNELDEHQRLLEQIDEVLDREPSTALDEIRALLGNHTEDNL